MIISIGATAYTPFGESTFLNPKDEIYVVIYDKNKNSYEQIKKQIDNDTVEIKYASVLKQVII